MEKLLNNPVDKNFGTFQLSESVDIGIVAAATGLFRLVSSFNGSQITIEANINSGNNIIFPLSELNESKRYKFVVLDAANNQLFDSSANSVFELTTIINQTFNQS